MRGKSNAWAILIILEGRACGSHLETEVDRLGKRYGHVQRPPAWCTSTPYFMGR